MATEWTLRAAPAGETCCDEHQRVRCGKPALLLLSAGGIGSYHCIDIVFALLGVTPAPMDGVQQAAALIRAAGGDTAALLDNTRRAAYLSGWDAHAFGHTDREKGATRYVEAVLDAERVNHSRLVALPTNVMLAAQRLLAGDSV